MTRHPHHTQPARRSGDLASLVPPTLLVVALLVTLILLPRLG